MRRTTKFLLILAPLAAIGVGVAVWLTGFPPWHLAPTQSSATRQQEPTRLASVLMPRMPSELWSLAWSADGSYLAAGTSECSIGDPTEVFVVDVGKQAIVATLKVTGSVGLMAFSPDGKSLAVASLGPVTKGPADLVVFDIPAFTARFRVTANPSAPSMVLPRWFIDVAWTADSKTLYSIEVDPVGEGPELRRWDVSTFAELPVIKIDGPKGINCKALAMSPDGLTLAIAEQNELSRLAIRFFNLGTGTESSSIDVDEYVGNPRLGFTADGKNVGVFTGVTLSWWDVGTGQPATPARPQFALQPAGGCSLSPDCGKWVSAQGTRGADFGDINLFGLDSEKRRTVIKLTLTPPAKTWLRWDAPAKNMTWRVGSGFVALAFSPDGTKLAGTVELPNGLAVVIWAVPK